MSASTKKKPVRFSLMVAGQAGLGKTTLLATLFSGHIEPEIAIPATTTTSNDIPHHVLARTEKITRYLFESETEDHIRLQIEAIDTPGFDDNASPEMRAEEIASYLEQTFDEVLEEEQRIHRNPKFEDHRVHVLLYLLDPTSHGIKHADLHVLQRLGKVANVIPVIAKGDGISATDRQPIKDKVLADLIRNKVPVFQFQRLDAELFQLVDAVPFTVIGNVLPPTSAVRGRPYPWGRAETDNLDHCDFLLLQRAVLQCFRDELKETTEDSLYEKYRTEKLLGSQARSIKA